MDELDELRLKTFLIREPKELLRLLLLLGRAHELEERELEELELDGRLEERDPQELEDRELELELLELLLLELLPNLPACS